MQKIELIQNVPPHKFHDISKKSTICYRTPLRHVFRNSGFIGIICRSQRYITYIAFFTTTNIV